MFKRIRLALIALMFCGFAGCGNEVAFEHPTEQDLKKAREAMNLTAVPNYMTSSQNLVSTELTSSFSTHSIIPNLGPEKNAEREKYIQNTVNIRTHGKLKYYNRLGIPPSQIVQLTELTKASSGLRWDLSQIPIKATPETRKALQQEARKQIHAISQEIQKLILPYQASMNSQTGSNRFTVFNSVGGQQKYTEPEIPLSQITLPDTDPKILEQFRKKHRERIQKQMDEAGLTITSSKVEELLLLHENLDKLSKTTNLAKKMRAEGKNISHHSFTELNQKRNATSQKIYEITAPLHEAIRIKKEPERRAKHIETMELQYARQNKFPSGYDLGQLYDIQKALSDLNREKSQALQKRQQANPDSNQTYNELMKSYRTRRNELNRQKREIEARIR